MSRKKQSSKSAAEYEAIYNELKPFHRFRFKPKKSGFRPSEKGQLSKLWKAYSQYIEGYDLETYTFAPATKSQIKALKNIYHKKGPSKAGKDQPKNKMVVTNKGVFIPQGKVKAKVDYKIARPKITGKGESTKIVIDTPTRMELFIPRQRGETILDTYNRIRSEYPYIEEMYVDVKGHKGVQRYSPKLMFRYTENILSSIEDSIEQDGYSPEDVFTGFWVMVWKRHPQL